MKEKIMFPYFTWQQPTKTEPLDQQNAAKLEDSFYAQYDGLSVKACVRRALTVFAEKEKSIRKSNIEKLQPVEQRAFFEKT
jgi:hypothetical protein